MKIGIIGAYCTKFGELWNKSLLDLLAEAQLGALRDAQISAKEIQSLFVGNMGAGFFTGQMHLGAVATNMLHISCPHMSIEAACASGGLALSAGIMAIQVGRAEVVLVSGVEKMTDLDAEKVATILMAAASADQELLIGATYPAINALIAQQYMNTYGITRQQLAAVSIKNHWYGARNARAHFTREITEKDFLAADMIAPPLSLFDCAPISDGAAALVLCSENYAKKHNKQAVYVIGSGQATDTLALAQRASLTEFKAAQEASHIAYAQAGIGPQDIDVAEVHGAFTITELISLEDLGFFEKGKSVYAFQEWYEKKSLSLAFNTSGGLKAKGHPVGATGVAQACEIVQQLRGQCGQRQANNPRFGLTHNLGGCGTTAVVHIFAKE